MASAASGGSMMSKVPSAVDWRMCSACLDSSAVSALGPFVIVMCSYRIGFLECGLNGTCAQAVS